MQEYLERDLQHTWMLLSGKTYRYVAFCMSRIRNPQRLFLPDSFVWFVI